MWSPRNSNGCTTCSTMWATNSIRPSSSGGATNLRVGGDISRVIDLIINDLALRSALREKLDDYSENRHHSGGMNARGTVDGVHIDAYIPYESQLGDKLLLRVEELARFTDAGVIKGWFLLTLEAHVVTKMAALLDRPDTEKGQKDARELLALLKEGVDPAAAIAILFTASAAERALIPGYMAQVFELLPERARANKADRRILDRLRREWIDEAERQSRDDDSAGLPRPMLSGGLGEPTDLGTSGRRIGDSNP